jgi:hypothetical protein
LTIDYKSFPADKHGHDMLFVVIAGKNVTPDKKKADTINQGASNIRNGQKRQRANTSSVTVRKLREHVVKPVTNHIISVDVS